MIILVNVFALASAALFYFKKILPFAFVVGSFLWFALMISFWFILPGIVYRRAATFKDHFIMHFDENSFSVGNERGSRSWPWNALCNFLETPNFFHLYFDSRSFFLVPKTAFTNTDEIFQLRHLMKEKIKMWRTLVQPRIWINRIKDKFRGWRLELLLHHVMRYGDFFKFFSLGFIPHFFIKAQSILSGMHSYFFIAPVSCQVFSKLHQGFSNTFAL